LEPKDFGLIAMVTVFTALLSVFVNAGTGSGLVQKKNISQEDLSTIFFYNIAVGLIVCIIVFAASTTISKFYGEPDLNSIVKVLSLNPLFMGFSVVQLHLMKREVQLKSRTVAQLVGQLTAAAIGISMALYNFGVWALVYSSLASSIIATVLYWIQSSWRPTWQFRTESFNDIWAYSKNILYGNIIAQVVQKLDLLLIGKYVSPAMLGLYYKGKNLGQLPANQLGTILTQSYFPIMSRLQGDKNEFNKYLIIQASRIAWVSVPLFILISILSDEIIFLLYGEKWIGASIFLSLTSLMGLLYVNNAFKVYVCNALGRSDLTLKVSLTMGPLRIFFYIIVLFSFKQQLGVLLLFVTLFNYIISFCWLSIIVAKITEVTFWKQNKTLTTMAIASLLPSILVIFIKETIENAYTAIFLAAVSFCLIYFLTLLASKEKNTLLLMNKLFVKA
jgi:O-antigen/teichoic acid export membrane protein